MIFVDTNVFIYHVGGEHSLRDEARELIIGSMERSQQLVTSAEVLQELLHVYIRTGRTEPNLSDAFTLVESCVSEVWPVEREDVYMARHLLTRYPGLEARDLVHLACCLRRRVRALFTLDRALAAAWDARP